ncbi:MAG: hypothetical protein MZW92_73695 [Comamonadaceae bacterium]|nr:hypothetical protein [Comamonadaceae bacterium]
MLRPQAAALALLALAVDCPSASPACGTLHAATCRRPAAERTSRSAWTSKTDDMPDRPADAARPRRLLARTRSSATATGTSCTPCAKPIGEDHDHRRACSSGDVRLPPIAPSNDRHHLRPADGMSSRSRLACEAAGWRPAASRNPAMPARGETAPSAAAA